ncbi:MAG TPA: hypothetical protein VF830_01925, partial [Gemmatimonadales bacterium]
DAARAAVAGLDAAGAGRGAGAQEGLGPVALHESEPPPAPDGEGPGAAPPVAAVTQDLGFTNQRSDPEPDLDRPSPGEALTWPAFELGPDTLADGQIWEPFPPAPAPAPPGTHRRIASLDPWPAPPHPSRETALDPWSESPERDSDE